MTKFLIQDVFSIIGRGVIPTGIIEEGILKVGMRAEIENKTIKIKSIEAKNQNIEQAEAGMAVGILVTLVESGTAFKEQKSWLSKLFADKEELKRLISKYRGTSIEFK